MDRRGPDRGRARNGRVPALITSSGMLWFPAIPATSAWVPSPRRRRAGPRRCEPRPGRCVDVDMAGAVEAGDLGAHALAVAARSNRTTFPPPERGFITMNGLTGPWGGGHRHPGLRGVPQRVLG